MTNTGWNEADHPRDQDGEFSSGGSGGARSTGGAAKATQQLSQAADAVKDFGKMPGSMLAKKAAINTMLDEASRNLPPKHPAQIDIANAKKQLDKAKTFDALAYVAGDIAAAMTHSKLEAKSPLSNEAMNLLIRNRTKVTSQ